MIIKKSERGKYGQKKVSMNNAITPTAQAGLDTIACSMQISRSELLEQIGRGILTLVPAAKSRPKS